MLAKQLKLLKGLIDELFRDIHRKKNERVVLKNLMRIKKFAESLLERIESYSALPFNSIEKAIQAMDMKLIEDRFAIDRYFSYFSIDSTHLRNLFPELDETVREQFMEFISILERLVAQKDNLLSIRRGLQRGVDTFLYHVFGRCQLKYGKVNANFVFFSSKIPNSTDTISNLFKNKAFIRLIKQYKNLTFEEAYKIISKNFFENVILWNLNKNANLFEGFYGRNYSLNINIYFTTTMGDQSHMFVRPLIKEIKSEDISILPSADGRDWRVFVNINTLFLRLELMKSFFFHEIGHIFHKIGYKNYFENINHEGFATFLQFYNTPSELIRRLEWDYNFRFIPLISHPIKEKDLNRFGRATLLLYVFGLHMWLVIYFSKLNLKRAPNLTKLTLDLAQYMHGEYEKFFHAWFFRFRRFTYKQFLEQYLAGAKRLGIRNIFDTKLVDSLLSSL